MKIKDPIIKKFYNIFMADYRRKRYATDPVFRKKVLETNKQWRKDNPKKWAKIQREYRERAK